MSAKKTQLKIKREETDFTQAELEKIARITERQYQRYESGKSIPKADTAKLIALALNSTVEELF